MHRLPSESLFPQLYPFSQINLLQPDAQSRRHAYIPFSPLPKLKEHSAQIKMPFPLVKICNQKYSRLMQLIITVLLITSALSQFPNNSFAGLSAGTFLGYLPPPPEPIISTPITPNPTLTLLQPPTSTSTPAPPPIQRTSTIGGAKLVRTFTSSDPSRGILNNITKVFFENDDQTRLFTEGKFQDRGNIRTANYTRYYLKKIIVSESTVVSKIKIDIPEPRELESSSIANWPFNGYITPGNFTEWQGIATAVFNELNLLRTNPKMYSLLIQDFLDGWQNQRSYRQGMYISTPRQGKKPWLQAKAVLESMAQLPPARRVKCLDESSLNMVRDTEVSGSTTSFDSKGQSPFERMRQACKISGGEINAYGFLSARNAVLQLLGDDGNPERYNRGILLKNFTVVGVAVGRHPQFTSVVVIDFIQ